MEPSEFEGTLERQEDALNAGALELLLSAPADPSFVLLDLSKEINDVCLSMFTLKDSMKHLDEASLNGLCSIMDEQALKLSEMKETYVNRRKILTAKVKKFYADNDSTTKPTPDGNNNNNTNTTTDMFVNCKELIDTFKVEFDHLAALSRFAETSFLSIHKSIREVPDPVVVLNETLLVCQRSHEALKKAQEQLQLANNTINNSKHGGGGGGGGGVGSGSSNNAFGSTHGHVATFGTNHASTAKLQSELDALLAKEETEREEMKQSYLTELVNVRSRFEVEMRNREHELKSTFEKQQLGLQKHCDATVAKLEVEITSLLNSLNEHKLHSIENDERRKMLDSEVIKRRELEERLRASFNNLSTCESVNVELKLQIEKLTQSMTVLEDKSAQELKSIREKFDLCSLELVDTQVKLSAVSSELATRPPVDFSNLMDKIGMVNASDHNNNHNNNSNNNNNNNNSEGSAISNIHSNNNPNSTSWNDIESYVVESVRKSNSEATCSRVREQEGAKQLLVLESKYKELWKQLGEQNALSASLEKDLLAAHSMLQQQQQQQQIFNKAGKLRSGNVSLASTPMKEIPTNGNAMAGSVSGAEISAETVQLLEEMRKESAIEADNHDNNSNNNNNNNNFNDDNDDSNAPSGSDRIMLAIQGQRDRFMKACREKDTEISQLKMTLDRLEDEQGKLRKENLELYRRLRVLRVGNQKNSNSSNGGGGVGGNSAYGSGGNRIRSRKGVDHDEDEEGGFHSNSGITHSTEGDALDDKYMNLYEAEISPFKVEELDKQSILTKLNVFERLLVYMNKNVIQDRWSRHAFIVYLILVHIFALCYTFSVLNPQLIEEVDEHLKNKWSAETLAMVEHPDI